jgi:hypothetical protein
MEDPVNNGSGSPNKKCGSYRLWYRFSKIPFVPIPRFELAVKPENEPALSKKLPYILV